MNQKSCLEKAWAFRKSLGSFKETQALRVFHGPGEGNGFLRQIACDAYGPHYWLTVWSSRSEEFKKILEAVQKDIIEFYRDQGARSIGVLLRTSQGSNAQPACLWGDLPQEPFVVKESQGRYWIRFVGSQHPGLFLDHAPLRQWLAQGAVQNQTVLNAFAYTGSLSVAAAYGGARCVLHLDISKKAIEWAKKNWELNSFPESQGQFVCDDVFSYFLQLKRKKMFFDCLILDPPSFSRGESGCFSVFSDLEKLHRLAMDLVAPQGLLITSINSIRMNLKQLQNAVLQAAQSQKTVWSVLREIHLPESFPTFLQHESDRYLKGWILKRHS